MATSTRHFRNEFCATVHLSVGFQLFDLLALPPELYLFDFLKVQKILLRTCSNSLVNEENFNNTSTRFTCEKNNDNSSNNGNKNLKHEKKANVMMQETRRSVQNRSHSYQLFCNDNRKK